jgi:23S rRNA (cytosine1962-C5)-methyltransferase
MATGSYSPDSQIRVRIWSFEKGAAIGPDFFRERLGHAVAERARILEGTDLTACRLVNAESDGLPGLVVDRYGDFLVCQFLSSGTEFFKDEIVILLAEITHARVSLNAPTRIRA